MRFICQLDTYVADINGAFYTMLLSLVQTPRFESIEFKTNMYFKKTFDEI